MSKIISLLRKVYFSTGIQYCPKNTFLGYINYAVRKIFIAIKSGQLPGRASKSKKSDEQIHIIDNRRLFEFQPISSSPSILILKLDHIGDIIVAEPAFKKIKDYWPNSTVTLLCRENVADLANDFGYFDKVIPFNFFPASENIGKGNPTGKPTLPPEITGQSYNLAFDLRHDEDTRGLLADITADYKIGFHTDATIPLLDISLPQIEWKSNGHTPSPHAKDRLALLVDYVASFFTPGLIYSQIKNPSIQQSGTDIGVCISTGAETKQWPLSYFVKLIAKLLEEPNTTVHLLGGKNEISSGEWISGQLNCNIKNHVGKIDFPETIELISSMKLFIGGDTGLTHLASFMDVPTINIFSGAANREVWLGRGKHTKILYKEKACSPCYFRNRNECLYNLDCLTSIDPQLVVKECSDLLTIK